MENLFQLKNNLDKIGIFLSFNGPISQNLMVELGEVLKKQMEMVDAGTSTIVKVFSALVEQSQNIIHHSAETVSTHHSDEAILMFGTIAVGFTDNKYFVLGGNKIKKEDEAVLKSHLKQIQNLSRIELKELYHQKRKEKTIGLGLIDLARKASEPIQYDFEPIDGQYTFFSIRTFI